MRLNCIFLLLLCSIFPSLVTSSTEDYSYPICYQPGTLVTFGNDCYCRDGYYGDDCSKIHSCINGDLRLSLCRKDKTIPYSIAERCDRTENGYIRICQCQETYFGERCEVQVVDNQLYLNDGRDVHINLLRKLLLIAVVSLIFIAIYLRATRKTDYAEFEYEPVVRRNTSQMIHEYLNYLDLPPKYVENPNKESSNTQKSEVEVSIQIDEEELSYHSPCIHV